VLRRYCRQRLWRAWTWRRHQFHTHRPPPSAGSRTATASTCPTRPAARRQQQPPPSTASSSFSCSSYNSSTNSSSNSTSSCSETAVPAWRSSTWASSTCRSWTSMTSWTGPWPSSSENNENVFFVFGKYFYIFDTTETVRRFGGRRSGVGPFVKLLR